jgi:hypothetical protein
LPIEIVLLFKAKAMREKDQLDFKHALDAMAEDQTAWLRDALMKTAPSHPWLEFL